MRCPQGGVVVINGVMGADNQAKAASLHIVHSSQPIKLRGKGLVKATGISDVCAHSLTDEEFEICLRSCAKLARFRRQSGRAR